MAVTHTEEGNLKNPPLPDYKLLPRNYYGSHQNSVVPDPHFIPKIYFVIRLF
jgi:hypothetical protein